MIPRIIKLVLNNVHIGVNWIIKHFNMIAVVALFVTSAIITRQNNKIDQMNADIDRLNNNIEYYQEQNDSIENNNKLLVLTINDLQFSKDSVIRQLYDTKKKLKIKDKQLKAAYNQKQEIKVDTTIVVKEPEFDKIIKPNALTSVRIIKKDSTLQTIIDIQNTQCLYLSCNRIYKRKYKNWFNRLLHFDFKKKNDYRYQIVNSNKLINITDTRLVKVED